MERTWEEFANYMEKEGYEVTFRSEDEDDCVYCPECGEPIYEADYPKIDMTVDDFYVCPICYSEF